MDNKVSITINNDDGTLDTIKCDSYKQFRILWFDEEGCPHVNGELPLRMIRKPFSEWAKAWAEEHALEIGAMLRQYRPEVTPAEIIATLEEVKNEDVRLSELKNGNRDNTVVYYMVGQLVKAMLDAFRQVVERITTIWEFPQFDKNSSNRVLDWLFRRR